MKIRTIEEMVKQDGATLEEAQRATALYEMLKPSIKINKKAELKQHMEIKQYLDCIEQFIAKIINHTFIPATI